MTTMASHLRYPPRHNYCFVFNIPPWSDILSIIHNLDKDLINGRKLRTIHTMKESGIMRLWTIGATSISLAVRTARQNTQIWLVAWIILMSGTEPEVWYLHDMAMQLLFHREKRSFSLLVVPIPSSRKSARSFKIIWSVWNKLLY